MISLVRSARYATSFIVLITVTAAWNCHGGGGPGPTVFRKCDVDLHDYWPGTLTVTKPSECPIKIPAANYPVDFAEGGTFGAGTVGTVRVTVYDANDRFVTDNFSVQVSTIGGALTPQRDTLSISGTYHAGVAGFGGSKTDRAVNDVEISGQRRLATAKLTYQQLGAATVVGPSEVNPSESFSLDADLHVANAVPPLSWAWYVNGTFAASSEILNWGGNNPGDQQQFEVRITEGNGTQWTEWHSVSTRTCILQPPALQCDP